MSTPWIWKKWWVMMWAAVVVVLIVLAFVLPVRVWGLAATIGFGVPEGFALWHGARYFPHKHTRHTAPSSPLTYVTRYYLPRWLTYTLTGGLVGTIAASWFDMPRPLAIGALFALYSWLVEHWEVTYREIPEPRKA